MNGWSKKGSLARNSLVSYAERAGTGWGVPARFRVLSRHCYGEVPRLLVLIFRESFVFRVQFGVGSTDQVE